MLFPQGFSTLVLSVIHDLFSQIDAALSSAHEAWKEDEEERFQTHLRSMLRQADKDHERKLADALKKKEIDWKAKCKKISDEGISSRQRSEREIVLLNKKLSEGMYSKWH